MNVKQTTLVAKKNHAVQWARHYSREAMGYKKRGCHLAAVRAFVQRDDRMRIARLCAKKIQASHTVVGIVKNTVAKISLLLYGGVRVHRDSADSYLNKL